MERTVSLPKAVVAFGGYSEMARRLKVPLSTCHGWARRDKLPHWRAKEIAIVARRERLDVWTEVKKRGRNRAKKMN